MAASSAVVVFVVRMVATVTFGGGCWPRTVTHCAGLESDFGMQAKFASVMTTPHKPLRSTQRLKMPRYKHLQCSNQAPSPTTEVHRQPYLQENPIGFDVHRLAFFMRGKECWEVTMQLAITVTKDQAATPRACCHLFSKSGRKSCLINEVKHHLEYSGPLGSCSSRE
ncbi:hypothetical protein HPB47_012428 [Ixodes persulcatus]|uniref:Uncharacterized protein n=1 Tax=Ixodes persulcatus TaxID=34615 RepID=A0AC60NTK3_IXOPE|nr:hypothetical protein HPB47_012428 [Ixodes persulcatus]